MHTYYTLSYAPESILSDTNYYIALYVFLFPWQPTLCSILLLFLYLGGSTGSGQQCSNYQVSIFHTVQQLLVRHTSNNAATIRQAHPKQ